MTPRIDLGPFPTRPGFDDVRRRDVDDPLASFAARFEVADPSLIYLDGNSLGRLPSAAPAVIDHVVRAQWGDRLIRSWNEGWWDLASDVGDLIAPLIGAGPGEVIVSESTTTNLHKLAGAALDARPERTTLVTDDLNFPSDIHVLAGLAARSGRELCVVGSDGVDGPVDGLLAAIDETTALVSLSSTAFKSGYTYDLAAITAAAHDVGALVLWDLSHSAGAVEIDLGGVGADLAVGCTYKFLNGGPGSPAFLYVRRDLQDELHNPITGWWGDADPFEFGLDHAPATGIRRFQVGTAPVLSLAATAPGIELVAEAGMPAIAVKGRALVEFVRELADERLVPLGFRWASPRQPARCGAAAALAHADAWRITRALIEIGNVVPDFRTPDNLRLGLSPLTTSFVDVHTAIERLALIVESGIHESFTPDRTAVT
ncbi:MAG: aminotransferase class V-fold PLP-dependent enzyme [Acidimicrobiales bacterium]